MRSSELNSTALSLKKSRAVLKSAFHKLLAENVIEFPLQTMVVSVTDGDTFNREMTSGKILNFNGK